MLIEFRVTNFRSFRDEAALSLLASRDQHLSSTNLVSVNAPRSTQILRSAVVYGANASGKSNLLRALQFMRGMVVESAAFQPEQGFNVQPFRLDGRTIDEPSRFEITIGLNGVRYQYGFELTPKKITAEWLLVYQTSKPQRWFIRESDPKTNEDKYEFSSFLVGQKRTWQEATHSNALFLSRAVQLNSEQLQPLVEWFSKSLVPLMEGGSIPFHYSTAKLQDPAGQQAVRSLLEAADISIAEINAVRQKAVTQTINFDFQTGKSNTLTSEGELVVPKFKHVHGKITAEFELGDESQGTQKLFSLAGPLLDILKEGKVLVIDELDRSLHPLLVRQIINAFQNAAPKDSTAQLIFSTHDTSLLDSELLRRDQIWLTEKMPDQSSRLVPLAEFSPRKNEALEKGYLGGRYGGIPILGDTLIDGTRRVS
jgi:AAA15 family ATPase/GTPase